MQICEVCDKRRKEENIVITYVWGHEIEMCLFCDKALKKKTIKYRRSQIRYMLRQYRKLYPRKLKLSKYFPWEYCGLCKKNFLDHSPTSLTIFDNRYEICNPCYETFLQHLDHGADKAIVELFVKYDKISKIAEEEGIKMRNPDLFLFLKQCLTTDTNQRGSL